MGRYYYAKYVSRGTAIGMDSSNSVLLSDHQRFIKRFVLSYIRMYVDFHLKSFCVIRSSIQLLLCYC